MAFTQPGAATDFAGLVAARLDRLPFSRSLWRLVFLISLGGAFEFYDLFLSPYVAPGLVSAGIFAGSAPLLSQLSRLPLPQLYAAATIAGSPL